VNRKGGVYVIDVERPTVAHVIKFNYLNYTLGARTMTERWFDSELSDALAEGAIWDRRKGNHEGAVEIVKCVKGRIGTRFLVQGLESGRQWLVTHSTLLGTYAPRKTAPPL
jgi:hypothetical protein